MYYNNNDLIIKYIDCFDAMCVVMSEKLISHFKGWKEMRK